MVNVGIMTNAKWRIEHITRKQEFYEANEFHPLSKVAQISSFTYSQILA